MELRSGWCKTQLGSKVCDDRAFMVRKIGRESLALHLNLVVKIMMHLTN